MRGTMTIRTKLLLALIPTAILVIATIAVSTSFLAARETTRLSKDSMQLMIDKTTQELQLWLADREREVQVLGCMPSIVQACEEKNPASVKAWLSAFHKLSPNYEAIWVADAQGVILVDSIDGKATGIEVATLPQFKENIHQAQAGKIWISPAGASPATGHPVVLVTAPIQGKAGLIGIMGAPVELNCFSQEFVGANKVGETGNIFILDRSGITLAHADPVHILKTDVSQFDFGRAMLAAKNGFHEYQWKGTPKIACFATNPKTGWLIAVALQTNEYLAAVHKMQWSALSLGVAGIVLLSLLVWLTTRGIFQTITQAVNQLSQGSQQTNRAAKEIATASASMASGASEQASSLEETSASLEELTSMTRHNADNTTAVQSLVREAKGAVDQGAQAIETMTSTIDEIKASADETVKIVKTIDDVAFQTNLLALNAAVEAARAGDAGKGFAVVAEEVRDLAQRSAAAAKNTQELLEKAQKKATQGVGACENVSTNFSGIQSNTDKVAGLVDEIASATQEQSQGIEQINTAITQIDQVTQSNAASSEEAASASQELAGQATQLNTITQSLSQIIGGGRKAAKKEKKAQQEQWAASPAPEEKRRHAPIALPRQAQQSKLVDPDRVIALNDDDLSDF